MGKVLVACEESQRVTVAFRAAGHDAWSCDLLPCSSGHPEWHIQGDVLPLLRDPWDLVIAHPPCTRLCNSGVRWLHERNLWGELCDAAWFYRQFRKANSKRICIENPVMHLHAKKLVGEWKLRQVVQPHYFGEPMFKATGFELVGLPKLIRTHHMTLPKAGTAEHKAWSWVHRCPPGPDRERIRSTTPAGIAHAFAEQWGPLLDTTNVVRAA